MPLPPPIIMYSCCLQPPQLQDRETNGTAVLLAKLVTVLSIELAKVLLMVSIKIQICIYFCSVIWWSKTVSKFHESNTRVPCLQEENKVTQQYEFINFSNLSFLLQKGKDKKMRARERFTNKTLYLIWVVVINK